MSLLGSLRGYHAVSTPNAWDDYWYHPVEGPSTSGIRITPENALKTSAVYACVRLISEAVASLPFITYRRVGERGKVRAPSHPVYTLLHDEPCREPRITPFQFKATMQARILLRGNAYAEIVPGPRGFADQLRIFADPDGVKTELVGNTLRYQVKDTNGVWRPRNAEDIFHLTGLSLDGVNGVSVIRYGAETFGLSQAAESYAARVFSQDATPRGVLQHPGRLSQDAVERLRAGWHDKHGGLSNAHKPAILEEGMKWQAISMTAEDAQLLAAREFQVIDVARWFNVPLHMVQSQQKSTSWGSGIEQMGLGFVTYTLLPWLKRWEDTVRQQLIVSKNAFFGEFLVDALLRGNQKDRYSAYGLGRYWGFLSSNDIRAMENMNPIEGEGGDIYLQPLNMVPLGTPPQLGGGGGANQMDDSGAMPSGDNALTTPDELAALAWSREYRNGQH